MYKCYNTWGTRIYVFAAFFGHTLQCTPVQPSLMSDPKGNIGGGPLTWTRLARGNGGEWWASLDTPGGDRGQLTVAYGVEPLGDESWRWRWCVLNGRDGSSGWWRWWPGAQQGWRWRPDMKGGGLGGVRRQVAEVGDWRVTFSVALGFHWQQWVPNYETNRVARCGRWVTRGADGGSDGRPPANEVRWAA